MRGVVGGYAGTLSVVDMDEGGNIRALSSVKWADQPSWLHIHKGVLYVACEWSNRMAAFNIKDKTTLEKLGDDAVFNDTRVGGICHCNVQGGLLIAAFYMGGIGTVKIDENGALVHGTEQVYLLDAKGLHKRQEMAHPHAIHPLDGLLAVPDLGEDSIRFFSVAGDGLVEEERKIKTGAAHGPRHITTHGDWIYALNELDNSVSLYRSDQLAGTWSLLPDEPHEGKPFSQWHAASLAVSPDGKTLVATNRADNHDPWGNSKNPRHGPGDTFAVFAIGADGSLMRKALVPTRGQGARFLAFTPDARYLVVACHDSNNISVFDMNYEYVSGYEGDLPACVVWME